MYSDATEEVVMRDSEATPCFHCLYAANETAISRTDIASPYVLCSHYISLYTGRRVSLRSEEDAFDHER